MTTMAGRRLGVMTLLTAVALAVTSCADDSPDAEEVPTLPPELGDVLDNAPSGFPTIEPRTDGPSDALIEPRTVDDQYGQVELLEVPERVVTLGQVETDVVLSLGVTPVAVGEFGGGDLAVPWRSEPEITSLPTVRLTPQGYSISEILRHDPHLVIADWNMSLEAYRELSRSVPVVSLPANLGTAELADRIGIALDKESEADELVAGTEAALEQARREYPELAGTTVGVAFSFAPSMLFNNVSVLEGGLLHELGVKPAPGLVTSEPPMPLNPSQWEAFDGDVLLVRYLTPAEQAKIEALPEFKRIPAVAAGRYLGSVEPFAMDLWAARSPAQIQYALEHAVPEIAELLR